MLKRANGLGLASLLLLAATLSNNGCMNSQSQALPTGKTSLAAAQPPAPAQTLVPTQTSTAAQTSAPVQTSAPTPISSTNQTSAPAQTLAPNQTSVSIQTAIPGQTSVPDQTTAPTQTSAAAQTSAPAQTSVQSSAPAQTSAPTQTSAPDQTSTSSQPLAQAQTPAAVSLSPPSMAFVTQVLATTSTAQSVTLLNSGMSALTISGIAIAQANAGDFGLTHNCPLSPSTLAGGASCVLTVSFAPTAIGPRRAAVTVTDSAAGSPHTAVLTGVATAMNPSPAGLTFVTQALGTASAAQTVTLKNAGSVAANLWQIAILGPNATEFSETTTCGASLAPGANCAVSVRFQPAASGARSATLVFSDDGGGSPQSVTLSGTGAGPLVSLPASLAFSSVPLNPGNASMAVTLTNSGGAPLTFTSNPSINGTNAADFAITVATCSTAASVAAGASCTVTVVFTPATSAIAETASLNFADNATPGTQTVPLSGTGIHWIGLQGTNSTTSGVTSYNVYRGTKSGTYGGSPVASCSTLTTSTSCMDVDPSLVPGTTYFYVVTAVRQGLESVHSNETSAVFP